MTEKESPILGGKILKDTVLSGYKLSVRHLNTPIWLWPDIRIKT